MALQISYINKDGVHIKCRVTPVDPRVEDELCGARITYFEHYGLIVQHKGHIRSSTRKGSLQVLLRIAADYFSSLGS